MENKQSLEKKVVNGLVWKFLERFSAQIVTFIVSIILARILSTEDYGIIGLVNAYICIANVFVTSGFGNALIQKNDADDVDFSTVFYCNIIISLIIYLILFLIAPFIAGFFKIEILSPVFRVLSLTIIIASIKSIQHAYISKKMMFFKFFWATLIGTIISAIVGIIMAYNGFGVWSIVAQHLTNMFIDTLVLWIIIKWRPSKKIDFKRLPPLLNFGWKLLLDHLFTTIYNNLKSFVIGKVYTANDLGLYTRGVQFPELIVTNINSSISAVLFPAYSKIQNDLEKLKKALRMSIRMSSFFLMPMLIGLFAIAPILVSVILTDKWLGCVPYLRIACIYYLFFPMTTADLEALLAIGKSDISLRLTIIKRLLGISLIFISIKFGVIYVAISDLIVVVFSCIINFRYMKKFFNYLVITQIADVLPALTCSIVMGGVVYFIQKITLNCNSIVSLILQIVIGIITYIVIAYLFNKKDLLYIINKIIKKGNVKDE